MRYLWVNRAHQIEALCTVSRLNIAAQRMFTSKRAVNSGQISNRFMFTFFSSPSLPLTHTHAVTPPLGATGVGSDDYEMSYHWMRVSASVWTWVWQETTMLSAFLGLYPFMPSSYPLSLFPFFSWSILFIMCPVYSASPSLCVWHILVNTRHMCGSICNDLLPYVALCAVLVCNKKKQIPNIHLISSLEHMWSWNALRGLCITCSNKDFKFMYFSTLNWWKTMKK